MTAKQAFQGAAFLAFAIASGYAEEAVKWDMRAHAPGHALDFSDYFNDPRYMALRVLWAVGFFAFVYWVQGVRRSRT